MFFNLGGVVLGFISTFLAYSRTRWACWTSFVNILLRPWLLLAWTRGYVIDRHHSWNAWGTLTESQELRTSIQRYCILIITTCTHSLLCYMAMNSSVRLWQSLPCRVARRVIEASEKVSKSKLAADVLGVTRLNLFGLGLTLIGLQVLPVISAAYWCLSLFCTLLMHWVLQLLGYHCNNTGNRHSFVPAWSCLWGCNSVRRFDLTDWSFECRVQWVGLSARPWLPPQQELTMSNLLRTHPQHWTFLLFRYHFGL